MQVSVHRYSKENQWDTPPDVTLDSDSTLLLFFASSILSDVAQPLEKLREQFPHSHLMGCSTSGEIYGDVIYDHGISLSIIKFDKTKLRAARENLSSDSGNNIAKNLNAEDLRAVFVLSDGIDVNGSRLVASLTEQLGNDVVITGGLAGDDDRFEKTWVWGDSGPAAGLVTAIGFYGDDVRVRHGSRGGWDVLGAHREVTRSEGNVLYELDGQPALSLYKKFLGDRAQGLPATGLLFPLAIKNEEEIDGYTVRTILGIDEETNSITFAGDIPEGVFVRLMSANFDRLIDGAADAAASVNMEDYSDGPLINIAISCVGRRLILGQRAEEEVEVISQELPNNTRQIGFYSYGEISPLLSGRCDLHNQTMTLSTIWET